MKKITLLAAGLAAFILPAQAQVPIETGQLFGIKPALVDFKAYDSLIHVVQEHRKTRMLNLDQFLAEAAKPNVVIIDTRSDEMYNAKHVKGAIHLNFADFTQSNLYKLFPDPETKILIYCNNNFDEGYPLSAVMNPAFIDPAYFVTKGVSTSVLDLSQLKIITSTALTDPSLYTAGSAPAKRKPAKKKEATITAKAEQPAAVAATPVKPAEEQPKPAPKPAPRPLTLALNIPTYINLYGYGYKNVYELSELVDVNDPRIQFEGTAVTPRQTGALFTAPQPSEAMRNAPRNADGTPQAHVDFGAYDSLTHIVAAHREKHLLHIDSFLVAAKQPGVLIIDTRSDAMYNAKHVKGAVHLNFSDFTVPNLARIIPSKDTKILIYCNNNFENDRNYFASKLYFEPTRLDESYGDEKSLTLALNIPTYINLYGYGYTNVYELADLVNVFSGMVEFEGTAVTGK
jgi:rhodanese-related sulfurtransferase